VEALLGWLLEGKHDRQGKDEQENINFRKMGRRQIKRDRKADGMPREGKIAASGGEKNKKRSRRINGSKLRGKGQ